MAEALTFAARDLDWAEIRDMGVVPANMVIAQAVPEGHLLNLGFAIPPVRFEGDDSPITAEDIVVKAAARILVPAGALEGIIKVLQGNIETRNKIVMASDSKLQ